MIRSLIRCQRQSNHVGARGMKKIAELRRWQAPLWGAILGSLLCRMCEAAVCLTAHFTQGDGGR
jgi:hypothetical protein